MSIEDPEDGPVPTTEPELTDEDLAGREAESCETHIDLRGPDDDDDA